MERKHAELIENEYKLLWNSDSKAQLLKRINVKNSWIELCPIKRLILVETLMAKLEVRPVLLLKFMVNMRLAS